MSRAFRQGLHDPDLDSRHRLPVASGAPVAESQRLVANPALAFLIGLAAYVVIRQALVAHHLGLFVIGLVLLVVAPFLGQYHCLDCGVTGWALRASRHACPSMIARCHGQLVSRFRVLRLRTQFKLWIVLLLILLLFYAITAGARP